MVDFLKGLSPNELTGVRELQRRDLLHRASIYVNMVDNNSLDNYGKFFLMFFFLQNFTGIFHRLINYLSQLRSNIVLSSILVKILDGLAIILLVIVQHYTVLFFFHWRKVVWIFFQCVQLLLSYILTECPNFSTLQHSTEWSLRYIDYSTPT